MKVSALDHYATTILEYVVQSSKVDLTIHPFIYIFSRWFLQVLTSLVVVHFIVKYLCFILVSKDASLFATMLLGMFYPIVGKLGYHCM